MNISPIIVYCNTNNLPNTIEDEARSKSLRKELEIKYSRLLSEIAIDMYRDMYRRTVTNLDAGTGKQGQPYYISKSHSNGYVVIAISPFPIGIDIERIPYELSLDTIKKRINYYVPINYHKDVINYIDPHEGSILIWTRKEAFYKLSQDFKITQSTIYTTFTDYITGNGECYISKRMKDNMICTCYFRNEYMPSVELHEFNY